MGHHTNDRHADGAAHVQLRRAAYTGHFCAERFGYLHREYPDPPAAPIIRIFCHDLSREGPGGQRKRCLRPYPCTVVAVST